MPRTEQVLRPDRHSSVDQAHHMHAPAVDVESGEERTGPRKSWAVLAVALAAQILVVLDISVVNTALPSIGTSLGLAGGELQALVTAYLVMSGGALLLGGRIADLLDRRRIFLTGLAVFTVASLFSGFADNGTQLTVTRALQGLSAALLTPAALSIIMTTYSGDQRKKGLVLWGAVGSLGVAAGVLVGGALTTWIGWQAIFWINVPIGAIALVVARMVVPVSTTARAGFAQFDLPGAVTVLGGLMALMLALGGTSTNGWTSMRTLITLAISATLLFAFTVIERRATQPLIPVHTWKIRTLVSGTTVMLGITGILVGSVFLTSLFVQTVLGFSALTAGVAFLPFAFAITVGTQIARHLLAHMAPRTLAVAGLVLAGLASGLLATAPASAHYATNLLPGLVLLGVGVGMVFVPVSVTAMAGIPSQHAGTASGFLMTGHEVGAALGVAVLSAVAATAGSLTSVDGVAAGFSRGFFAAAVIAAVVAVIAFLRMSPGRVAAGGGGMHGH
jgi:EmrB/QacA subfamily drug resistance transporter